MVVCVSEVTSLVVNLQGRRDATFYFCGEVCRFISKLCSRCYLPETIPVENSWFLLLGFTVSEGMFQAEEDFLIRLRLVNKVATASKQNAEVVHLNKKSEKAAIDKTAEEAISSFAEELLLFIQYLLKEVLNQTGLRSEIVKGLTLLTLLFCLKDLRKLAFVISTCYTPPFSIDLGLRVTTKILAGTSILPYWITFE